MIFTGAKSIRIRRSDCSQNNVTSKIREHKNHTRFDEVNTTTPPFFTHLLNECLLNNFRLYACSPHHSCHIPKLLFITILAITNSKPEMIGPPAENCVLLSND